MAKGIQPDDKTKERVKALLATGKAKNQVAKEVGLSWATVDKISKEDPDELETLRERKREQFVNKIWQNIEDAIELGHEMVKDARIGKRDIPLSHISTYVGTLYDKQALMTGGNTANVGVDGEVTHNHEYNIEQTIQADPETAELLKQLWRRQAGSA